MYIGVDEAIVVMNVIEETGGFALIEKCIFGEEFSPDSSESIYLLHQNDSKHYDLIYKEEEKNDEEEISNKNE